MSAAPLVAQGRLSSLAADAVQYTLGRAAASMQQDYGHFCIIQGSAISQYGLVLMNGLIGHRDLLVMSRDAGRVFGDP